MSARRWKRWREYDHQDYGGWTGWYYDPSWGWWYYDGSSWISSDGMQENSRAIADKSQPTASSWRKPSSEAETESFIITTRPPTTVLGWQMYTPWIVGGSSTLHFYDAAFIVNSRLSLRLCGCYRDFVSSKENIL